MIALYPLAAATEAIPIPVFPLVGSINVAPGLISDTSTDAVNGSQLKAVVDAVDANTTEINNIKTIINNNDGVNEKINELRGDINEAGAKLAALAALKPYVLRSYGTDTNHGGYGWLPR